MGGQFLPRHRACDCRLVEFGNRSFGNLLAVAENGQALADFEHLAHLVADKENGNALRLNIAHDLEQGIDLVAR
ncbi:hypothetical protein D3C71_1909840 [compost metagenome]